MSPRHPGTARTTSDAFDNSPHFSRFLRFPAGQGLAKIQLSRMIQEGDHMSTGYSADEIGEIGQFLSTLLALQGPEGISAEDIDRIKPIFRTWKQMFRGRLAGEVGERCTTMLSNNECVSPHRPSSSSFR